MTRALALPGHGDWTAQPAPASGLPYLHLNLIVGASGFTFKCPEWEVVYDCWQDMIGKQGQHARSGKHSCLALGVACSCFYKFLGAAGHSGYKPMSQYDKIK